MANRRFQLTTEQLKGLLFEEDQTRRVQELKRLQAVRLYGTGWDVQTIIELVGCSARSLRHWITLYKRSGVAGLRCHYQTIAHNACKLTPEQEADFQRRLSIQPPEDLTEQAIITLVERLYGVRYADVRSYQQLMQRCGFDCDTANLFSSIP